jgi:hypothetical protein
VLKLAKDIGFKECVSFEKRDKKLIVLWKYSIYCF